MPNRSMSYAEALAHGRITNEVEISFHCPRCGRKETVEYEEGERCYGDLPRCANKCEVPFAVRDAIADWLDERVKNGAGQPTSAHPWDVCGYDGVER